MVTDSLARARRSTLATCALGLSFFGAGCASGMDGVGYYWQSVSGHIALMQAGEPIDEVLADQSVPALTRERLGYAVQAREFAVSELGLPDNGSYRRFADIGRSHVLWNVFATGELSLELERWCFPVAGCIGYRGYYDERVAHLYADRLAARGMDVQVAGVPAYSTLGWFDDPIPSTVTRFPKAYIARLIFHELAHQVVYVKNDSTFNESFATAVEIEGMRRWFAARRAAGFDNAEQAGFEASAARKQDFVALLRQTRAALKTVYNSDASDDGKRARKAKILDQLKADYAQMKSTRWNGFSGYDRWFAQPLGNAHLAAVGAYHDLVPGFTRLLRESGYRMDAFYVAVRKLAELPRDERRARLTHPQN